MSEAEPLAHLYALALRTLDAQERRADALRARLGPVLAAAALGATLLGGPGGGGSRPAGPGETVAIAVAFVGFAVAALAAAAILRARGLMAPVSDMPRLMEALDRQGALADPGSFYAAMISRLDRHSKLADAALERLHTIFTAMLCGILVMLCGLVTATIVG